MNTAFTAVYLLIILPLFGVSLPFRSTLVVVTFIMGLIPVVGNLVSNTVIVLISMSAGTGAGIASLTFLVVIHKLEYFLNAKIVGGEIHAAAWRFCWRWWLSNLLLVSGRDYRAHCLRVRESGIEGQAFDLRFTRV